MPLYTYKVVLSDDSIKESQDTAKTEQEFRERLASQFKIKEWVFLKEKKLSKTEIAQKSKPVSPKPKHIACEPTSSTKLGRMLYLQSGKCFFCAKIISEKEASIEHLHPTSKGGKRTDDNEVICCKALNETFGDMDLKRKFEFVIRSAGNFKCPSP